MSWIKIHLKFSIAIFIYRITILKIIIASHVAPNLLNKNTTTPTILPSARPEGLAYGGKIPTPASGGVLRWDRTKTVRKYTLPLIKNYRNLPKPALSAHIAKAFPPSTAPSKPRNIASPSIQPSRPPSRTPSRLPSRRPPSPAPSRPPSSLPTARKPSAAPTTAFSRKPSALPPRTSLPSPRRCSIWNMLRKIFLHIYTYPLFTEPFSPPRSHLLLLRDLQRLGVAHLSVPRHLKSSLLPLRRSAPPLLPSHLSLTGHLASPLPQHFPPSSPTRMTCIITTTNAS